MPAKPLTPEQISDAMRLRDVFAFWQGRRATLGLPSSQHYAAQQLGFGQSALSQYLRGAIPLNMRVLWRFADLFECDPAQISPTLARQMAQLKSSLERIEEEQRYTRPAASSRSASRMPVDGGDQVRLYPVISWKDAKAWSAQGDWSYDEEGNWLPAPINTTNNAFYLRIPSESMFDPADNRSFREGDLILVDSEAAPINGSFVVVKLNTAQHEEAVLRQLVIEGGRRYLKTLNPAWPDRITAMPDDALMCGVVKAKVVHY